jgi:hypothetical protein
MFKLRVILKCGATFISEDRFDKEWANRLAHSLRQCRNVAQVELVPVSPDQLTRSA